MSDSRTDHRENLLTRSKIVATIGPASDAPECLRRMVHAGVDVFRLNFAHGTYDAMATQIDAIRKIENEVDRPVGVLGDLSGPKIRLGQLGDHGLQVAHGERYEFVDRADPQDVTQLTTTYEGFIEDVALNDRVLLADGTVSMRVVEKNAGRVVCVVEQPGQLRSGQGVNLPGTQLRVPSLTEKDRRDLAWGVQHELDFIGLSFVRRASDIGELRQLIDESGAKQRPLIVAKIEKPEAVSELEKILDETDAVMVARGDLGVEVDIERVPAIQKHIVRSCNRRRVPVITATQMLDSMQHNSRPTRAEVSDVANAVLDGSDAVMLSGESAIGDYPVETVAMMSRIVGEIEHLVPRNDELPLGLTSRNAATDMTRGVVYGAMQTAERLEAKLIVVLTRSGSTAIAISELRGPIPIIALTDDPRIARWVNLAWGVHPIATDVCRQDPKRIVDFVTAWARTRRLVESDQRIVLVGTTDWTLPGKNLMLVHTVPAT